MKHRASPSLWEEYARLPVDAKRAADKCFELLKNDPRHPSLHFKKIGKYWSVRAGIAYRALGIDIEGGVLWFWIGPHAEYDSLIGSS